MQTTLEHHRNLSLGLGPTCKDNLPWTGMSTASFAGSLHSLLATGSYRYCLYGTEPDLPHWNKRASIVKAVIFLIKCPTNIPTSPVFRLFTMWEMHSFYSLPFKSNWGKGPLPSTHPRPLRCIPIYWFNSTINLTAVVPRELQWLKHNFPLIGDGKFNLRGTTFHIATYTWPIKSNNAIDTKPRTKNATTWCSHNQRHFCHFSVQILYLTKCPRRSYFSNVI